jgi:putative hydrolase of the HAD superfamily
MNTAVCLDFGETLAYVNGIGLNWSDHYYRAINQAFSIGNNQVNDSQISLIVKTLQRYNTREYPRETEYSDVEIFSKALEHAQIEINNLDLLITEFFNYFRVKFKYYEDVIPFLEEMKKRKIQIGILTDVPYGMRKEFVIHDLIPINMYIDCILTSVDIGFRKPNKSGYLKLAKELNTSVENALYVGNEEKDINGANKAGMKSVLIDRNKELPNYAEKYRIESLLEIVDIL